MNHAYEVIKDTYGDRVQIKPKNLLKFGRTANADADANTTLMTLAGTERHETYVSANSITHFASASAGDNQQLTVEGHTISGSNFTFVVQTVTLNGQTKTALTTPLARCTRVANIGSTNLTGPVYVAEDVTFTSGVPQTDSAIHAIIAAGSQQTQKAATAFSSQDYGLITEMNASVARGSGSVNVDVFLEIREFGKIFRPVLDFTIRTAGSSNEQITLDPYIIVPKNADVRMTATSDTNNTIVSGFFNAFIALVQS